MADDDAYAFTIKGIQERISARLADDDADDESSWDPCLIQSAVRDVLALISVFRSDLFIEEVPVRLAVGSCGQLLPEECPRIAGFVCVITSAGEQIPVLPGTYRQLQSIQSYPEVRRKCKASMAQNNLGITTFQAAVSPTNARRLLINPAPPTGFTYTLLVECVALDEITATEDQELPSELRPWILPIVELVLYQMLMIDSDDPTTFTRAQVHQSTFSTLSALNLNGLRDVIESLTNGNPRTDVS